MLKWLLKRLRHPKPPPSISPKLRAEMDRFITAMQNRPVYRALNESVLNTTPEDELELLVIDNLCAIIGADDQEEELIVQSFTTGQQAVYTSWIVEAEIWESGFRQFYFKPAGRYAKLVVEGFQTIGAPEFSRLMEEANRLFALSKSDLEKATDETSSGLKVSYKQHPLDELDDVFQELSITENLHDLRTHYIRTHPQAFVQIP